MGLEALLENGVTQKLVYFFRDDKVVPPSEPLRRVRPSRLALFVGIQLVGFAATFAITQTIGASVLVCFLRGLTETHAAAIGFPIVIFALVPIRMYIIPRLPFTEEELAILDGPAASSFVRTPPFLLSPSLNPHSDAERRRPCNRSAEMPHTSSYHKSRIHMERPRPCPPRLRL
jgi:hypothetical protein